MKEARAFPQHFAMLLQHGVKLMPSDRNIMVILTRIVRTNLEYFLAYAAACEILFS